MSSTDNKLLSDTIQYYNIKMSILGQYSDRTWNRFNWFLTIHITIFGAYFSQIDKLQSSGFFKVGIPIVAIAVAFLWSIMGIEDYLAIRKHAKRMRCTEECVLNIFSNAGINFDIESNQNNIQFRQSWLLFILPTLIGVAWSIIFVGYSMR